MSIYVIKIKTAALIFAYYAASKTFPNNLFTLISYNFYFLILNAYANANVFVNKCMYISDVGLSCDFVDTVRSLKDRCAEQPED